MEELPEKQLSKKPLNIAGLVEKSALIGAGLSLVSGVLLAVAAQNSWMPAALGMGISLGVYAVSKTVQSRLEWWLRHFPIDRLIAEYRADVGGGEAGGGIAVGDFLAVLHDPAGEQAQISQTGMSRGDALECAPVFHALHALSLGLVQQGRHALQPLRIRLESEPDLEDKVFIRMARTLWLLCECLEGSLSDDQTETLNLAAQDHRVLPRLLVQWVQAHQAERAGNPEQAARLFRKLKRAAPELRVLHGAVGTAQQVDTHKTDGTSGGISGHL